MLIDAYQPEDVFARVPELAAQIDPVLKQLDMLLDDDDLYQIQSRRCSASFLLLPPFA